MIFTAPARMRLIWRTLCCVALWLLSGCDQPEALQGAPPELWHVRLFTGAWEYRLGSSPLLPDGGWAWAQPDHDDGKWQRSRRQGLPPVRSGTGELWARARLPPEKLTEPTLALQLVGHSPEAYLNGRQVALEALPHHPWEARRSHQMRYLLRLDPTMESAALTLHLRSNGTRIGILSTVYCGERAAVVLALLRGAMPTLLLAVLSGLLGIVGLVLFLSNRSERALLYFFWIGLSLCFYFLSITGVVGLLMLPAPPSNVIFTMAPPFSTINLCAFIIRIFGSTRMRFLRRLQVALGLGLLAESMCILYDVRLLDRLIPPMNLLLLVAFPVIITSTLRSARRGDIDGKIIAYALLVGALLIIPDLLTLSGLWIRPTQFVLIQLAILMFFLSLGAVLVRRFVEVHQRLGEYSHVLSDQVKTLEQRNREIQTLNDELRRQIEQRSNRMIELLTRSRSGLGRVPMQPLSVGQMLGDRYRVIRELGQGAMGSVYLVERVPDGLQLAAKLLTVQTDHSAMVRFVREARILAQLQHPNLVAINDIDISRDGELFLVMELVLGSTLKDARARWSDLGFVWTVLRQISQGLKAIHAAGVVHRDLKPANILLAETPQGPIAKIADFGISILGNGADAEPQANPVDISVAPPPLLPLGDDEGNTIDLVPDQRPDDAADDAPPPTSRFTTEKTRDPNFLTQSGILLGTPMYMAPELAGGSRKAPAATDIFSLGVIAVELLTGKPPFEVPPVVAVWQSSALAAPPLAALRPEVPAHLTALILRCLDYNPSHRPTLDDLIAAIPERS